MVEGRRLGHSVVGRAAAVDGLPNAQRNVDPATVQVHSQLPTQCSTLCMRVIVRSRGEQLKKCRPKADRAIARDAAVQAACKDPPTCRSMALAPSPSKVPTHLPQSEASLG